MNKEDSFELGYIMKPHGINGEVVAFFDVDNPDDYINLESVFIEINNKLVPFFIDSIRISGKKVFVKFEDIKSIAQAETLKNAALYLSLNQLPELSEEQYYFHELPGLSVIDKNLGELGIVESIFELPHQNLISMMYQGKEVLIPMTDEIIKKVNRRKKELIVELPDGLLDIYLDDNANSPGPDEDISE